MYSGTVTIRFTAATELEAETTAKEIEDAVNALDPNLDVERDIWEGDE